MPKIHEYKGRHFITIPIEIIREQKWKKGDNLYIGTLIIQNNGKSKPIIWIKKLRRNKNG